MPLDIKRLSVFAALYETRSFIKAALKLGLSQSTVSGHLKRLEEEYGVALFERHSRQVVPTALARRLMPLALELLDQAARAEATLSQPGELGGRLLVRAGETLWAYCLPPVLASFSRLHPKVLVCPAGQGPEAQAGDEELALCLRPAPGRALTRLCLVTAAGYGQAGQGPLWLPAPGSELHPWLGHLALPAWPVAGYLPSQAALLRVVRAGFGAAPLTTLAARAGLASGALRQLELFDYKLGIEATGAGGRLGAAFWALLAPMAGRGPS